MVSDRTESRFVSNTVALVFQTAAATVLTLLQVKLLSNFLSRETFGLFASLRGFSLVLSMLAAHGLPQLLVRFLPVHESLRERRKALALVGWCVLIAAAGFLAAAFAAHAAERWTFRFASPDVLTRGLFIWFYATTAAVTLKLVLYGALNGVRRLAVQVLIETLSLAAVLLWMVVERGRLTLPLLFQILGVVNLVAAGAGFVWFLAFWRAGRRGGAPAPARRRGGYASYLGWAAALSLVALAFSDADRYLLAHVLSLELLAAFHIGSRVGRLANRLLGVANVAFQPEVTRLDTEGRDGRVAQSTRIFLKLNSVFAVAAAAALIVFAREMIILVSSSEYLAAAPLLVFFALSLPLTTMTAPVTTVMKAIDQVRGALWCDLAWALCYVTLILALGPPLGLIGVGVAQLAACAVQLFLALRLSKLAVGGDQLWRFSAKLALAAVVAFGPALAYGIIAGAELSAASLGLKAALFAGGAVGFRRLIGAAAVFGADERQALNAMFRARGLQALGRLVGV